MMIAEGPDRPQPRVSPVEAVLLDAHGTLLALQPPVPRLTALLADAGHPHPPDRVAAALGAEIAHYRAHHDLGRDPASLAALRRDCAGVLAAALGGDAPDLDVLTAILLAALRFELLPDALPALDALAARGVALGVVSNWDCSLPDLLAELGVADRFAAVSVSAVVGAAKPDPAIFADALGRLGVPADRALHCGDRPDADCVGARRAGLRAVLIDRLGTAADGDCPRVDSLGRLAALVSP
jgi:putative hydrolase of the HAD superfamily